jgi:hypothetical protein
VRRHSASRYRTLASFAMEVRPAIVCWVLALEVPMIV